MIEWINKTLTFTGEGLLLFGSAPSVKSISLDLLPGFNASIHSIISFADEAVEKGLILFQKQ